MTRYIGYYNVDNEGELWEANKRYVMVIFSKFDKNMEISKKNLYFLTDNTHYVPDFKSEKEIEEFLSDKKNNQKCSISFRKFC